MNIPRNILLLEGWDKSAEKENITLLNTLQKNEFKQLIEVAMAYIHNKITLCQALNIYKDQTFLQTHQFNHCFRLICAMFTHYTENTEENFKATMTDLGFSINLIDSSCILFKSTTQESLDNIKVTAEPDSLDLKYIIDISTAGQQTIKNPQKVLMDVKLLESDFQDLYKLEMDMDVYHRFRYAVSQLLFLLERYKKSETLKS